MILGRGVALDLVFLILGLMAIVHGLRRRAEMTRLSQEGRRTTGRLVNPGGLVAPLVSFTDDNGKTWDFRRSTFGATGLGGQRFIMGLRVGCDVPVVYLADAPRRAQIDHPAMLDAPQQVYIALGLIGVLVPTAFTLVAWFARH